jgi:hypothetical protein
VAYRVALDRHISELEARAGEAIKEKQQMIEHSKQAAKRERGELARRKALNRENAMYLLQQMAWNESKRVEDRKGWIEGASAHDFPTFTEPPAAQLKELSKQYQQQIRNDLSQQVKTNNSLKAMAKQIERKLENSQLVNNREELGKAQGQVGSSIILSPPFPSGAGQGPG